MTSSNVYSGSIAIVGGGISGLSLAIALTKRGLNITIYEAAHHFGEIGAGVAFHPAAERAMLKLDKSVHDAFHEVETHNLNPSKRHNYLEYYDGFSQQEATDTSGLFVHKSSMGINAVHRAAFLDELIKSLPDGIAHFAKRLTTLEGPDAQGKYTLHFLDGTTAVHDVVIGTDGIKSSVRKWLVGPDHPSAHPVYTHKYAYRGLIPMERAAKELGADVAGNGKVYVGKDGHMLTFAISKGATMNVVGFKHDPNDWPDYEHLTRHSTKEQVRADFEGYGPTVRKIVDLLEPELDCWAIFDTGDHPLQRYNKGKVVLLGDAGHATSPHHGSGAGICIEDAAVLTALLADPVVAANGDKGVEAAFDAYTAERITRTQRLVQSSRRAGDLCECRTELGSDMDAVEKELWWRYSYFWNGDVEQYIGDAKAYMDKMLSYEKRREF